MKIKERIEGGVAVLGLAGKLMGGPDLGTLHDHVKGLIADGTSLVVIDLGRVEWMNSAGLGALMSALISCRHAGGDLVVARATRKVNSVFMITQVLKVFDTFETVEEAVEAIKKGT